MKIIFSRIIFLAILCVPSVNGFSDASPHKISFTIDEGFVGGFGRGVCRGGYELFSKSVNLPAELVSNGYPCLAADFDGNDSTDYVVWEPVDQVDVKNCSVLFFSKNKLIKLQIIGEGSAPRLWTEDGYPKALRGKVLEVGSPGGEATYQYDKETKSLKEFGSRPGNDFGDGNMKY